MSMYVEHPWKVTQAAPFATVMLPQIKYSPIKSNEQHLCDISHFLFKPIPQSAEACDHGGLPPILVATGAILPVQPCSAGVLIICTLTGNVNPILLFFILGEHYFYKHKKRPN